METETKSFKITHYSNGSKMKKESPLTSILLSIATAGIIGCFVFLWGQNSTNAIILERDAQKTRAIDEINGKINTMQLDFREVRDKVIKMEGRQNKN